MVARVDKDTRVYPIINQVEIRMCQSPDNVCLQGGCGYCSIGTESSHAWKTAAQWRRYAERRGLLEDWKYGFNSQWPSLRMRDEDWVYSRGLIEPRRTGAIVEDVDGQRWRKGRTRWACQAKVGDTYLARRVGPVVEVTQVARLPWYALVDQYGPLDVIDLKGGATK